MKTVGILKKNIKFLVFILLFGGIIGGISTSIYTCESLDPKLLNSAIEKVGSKNLLYMISSLQAIIYVIVCGTLGVILSNKVGLWKNFELKKNKTKNVSIISLIGGFLFIFVDILLFGNFIEPVKQIYNIKPTIAYVISAFTYGGIVEEVMLRLFLMSLISWIIYKIFYTAKKEVPTKVFIIANIISALLFAAGHLPFTKSLFGQLTPIILIRCFVMNGSFGLVFGWLYRKYGIYYSMIAHFGIHLISKIIWVLLIIGK